jgi:hypothetical protein
MNWENKKNNITGRKKLFNLAKYLNLLIAFLAMQLPAQLAGKLPQFYQSLAS